MMGSHIAIVYYTHNLIIQTVIDEYSQKLSLHKRRVVASSPTFHPMGEREAAVTLGQKTA
jgi:hypothetical protein